MAKELVPYTFRSPDVPVMEPQAIENDELSGMGIWFTFPADDLGENLDTIKDWYETRDDVVLVDSGTSFKRDEGFIIMEWEGSLPDRLFIDILRTDPTIIDFAVYGIKAGGDQ